MSCPRIETHPIRPCAVGCRSRILQCDFFISRVARSGRGGVGLDGTIRAGRFTLPSRKGIRYAARVRRRLAIERPVLRQHGGIARNHRDARPLERPFEPYGIFQPRLFRRNRPPRTRRRDSIRSARGNKGVDRRKPNGEKHGPGNQADGHPASETAAQRAKLFTAITRLSFHADISFRRNTKSSAAYHAAAIRHSCDSQRPTP